MDFGNSELVDIHNIMTLKNEYKQLPFKVRETHIVACTRITIPYCRPLSVHLLVKSKVFFPARFEHIYM